MSARRGSIPSLDGLRAISISTVLLAHFVSGKIFPGGLGVYVFFIISGFLITRLLLAEQDCTGMISLKAFYVRRICRLYPVIIVFSCVVTLLDIGLHRSYDLAEPASALGYSANYFYVYLNTHAIPQKMPFEIFWSLSIEEHFYILFPLAFLVLNGNPRRLMWLLTALCLGCLLLRVVIARLHPEYIDTQIFYALSQYRLDSIGFGVILALACQTAQGRATLLRLTHPIYLITALMTLITCLLVRDPWFRETWRYSLVGLSILVVVTAILFGKNYRWVHWVLNTRLLRWIGRLSYSLYVWHEGVASFLPVTSLPAWQQAIICLVASLVVASISYYAVERPFLSLRGHFSDRRQIPLGLPGDWSGSVRSG